MAEMPPSLPPPQAMSYPGPGGYGMGQPGFMPGMPGGMPPGMPIGMQGMPIPGMPGKMKT